MTRFFLFGLVLAACGRAPGGDPMRLVPADAARAIIAPKLATLQARTAGFLAGVEGASGVLDLVADRFGLDLRTPEGPEELGLDTSQGIAVFGRGENTWVAVASVAAPETFLSGVRARLEKGAGAALAAGQPDEPPEGGAWLFEGPRASWHAALGVTRDRIGVLVLVTDGGDAVTHWNEVAAGQAPGFAGSPVEAKARAALAAADGGEAVAWLLASNLLPDAPRELGMARGLVQGVRDALPLFVGGAAITGSTADSLVVELTADHTGEGTLPISWVSPAGSPEALAKAFPKTTTAFLRLRFEIEKVRSLPGFLRDTLLPERLPGLEALPLPAVSDLIDLVEGDVAIGVLGLDPSANLAQLSSLRALRERALTALHLAIAARLHDPAATLRAFSGIASQLATSGWTVATIGSTGSVGPGAPPAAPSTAYQGWSFAREGAHYAVLVDGQIAVFIVGAGEVDGFLAVKDGRGLSLAAFAEGGSRVIKQALGLEGKTPLGLTLSPLRLSRELSARGLPPYFLKIINDLRLVAATVTAEDKRLGIALEIAL